MAENTQEVFRHTKESMEKALEHLVNELSKLRAGKAAPQMLDGIYVDYYGTHTPLNQLATINTPDPKTITIQPWEKSMIQPIEKAIMGANIGLNPQNDGNVIHVNIPPLTEERRKELVKFTKHEGEQTKVSVRNIRKDANEQVKKLQKDGLPEDEAKRAEDKIQEYTNDYIKKIENLLDVKEKEIMTV